jgi:hypothetical protein
MQVDQGHPGICEAGKLNLGFLRNGGSFLVERRAAFSSKVDGGMKAEAIDIRVISRRKFWAGPTNPLGELVNQISVIIMKSITGTSNFTLETAIKCPTSVKV